MNAKKSLKKGDFSFLNKYILKFLLKLKIINTIFSSKQENIWNSFYALIQFLTQF